MQQGDALPTIEKKITQRQVERYAQAAGDFNPIHIDPDFAMGAQFGGAVLEGTIAHGMMILASVSEMLTLAFGERWLDSGSLKIRFRGPVYPGEAISAFGNVKSVNETAECRNIVCAVGVRNQDCEIVISGDAAVSVALDG